jgi:hypothetical protein
MKTSDKICIAFEAFMMIAAVAVVVIGIIGSIMTKNPEPEPESPKTEQPAHVTPHTYQQVHPVSF